MKNINIKTKKRIITVVGILASTMIIVMIATQFKKEPMKDTVISHSNSEAGSVVVDTPNESDLTKNSDVNTAPSPKTTEGTQNSNGAVDTGTEQKIQEDIPKKPTYTKEQLTDPTKKPNGEKVESPPKDAGNENTSASESSKTKTESSGGLPGFSNVPDGGANQVTKANDMYENGKKIGKMN